MSSSSDKLVTGDGIRCDESQPSLSIRPTCVNCEHYCSAIHSIRGGFWNQPNFCTLWRTAIPTRATLPENSKWDDIETGLAYCYGFTPKSDGNYITEFKSNAKSE